jgi:hypothetical protein
MNKHTTSDIDAQARLLWGSYAQQSSRMGNEQFWANYDRLKQASLQQQQDLLVNQTSQSAYLSFDIALFKMTPHNKKQHKLLLWKDFLSTLGFTSLLVTVMVLFGHYVLDIAEEVQPSVEKSVMAWISIVFLLNIVFGWEYPQAFANARLQLKFDNNTLLTGGRHLIKRSIAFADIQQVEMNKLYLVVDYRLGKHLRQLHVPRTMDNADVLKVYLEAIVEKNR